MAYFTCVMTGLQCVTIIVTRVKWCTCNPFLPPFCDEDPSSYAGLCSHSRPSHDARMSRKNGDRNGLRRFVRFAQTTVMPD